MLNRNWYHLATSGNNRQLECWINGKLNVLDGFATDLVRPNSA